MIWHDEFMTELISSPLELQGPSLLIEFNQDFMDLAMLLLKYHFVIKLTQPLCIGYLIYFT